jgi:hypothetical protein
MIQLDPLPWCPEESTPLEPFPPSLAACCNQEADPRLYTASNGSHRRETDRTGLLRLYERLSYHLCCLRGPAAPLSSPRRHCRSCAGFTLWHMQFSHYVACPKNYASLCYLLATSREPSSPTTPLLLVFDFRLTLFWTLA